MASHKVTFDIPQKVVLAKDIEFEVKSNNNKTRHTAHQPGQCGVGTRK